MTSQPEDPRTKTALTCGLYTKILFGMMDVLTLPKVEDTPLEYRQFMVSIPRVSFELVDRIAMLVRGSNTNLCYETRGQVTHDNKVDLKRVAHLQLRGLPTKWQPRKEHVERLLKLIK